jgi:hypothetical protein
MPVPCPPATYRKLSTVQLKKRIMKTLMVSPCVTRHRLVVALKCLHVTDQVVLKDAHTVVHV